MFHTSLHALQQNECNTSYDIPFFDLPITLFTFQVLRIDFHQLLFLNAKTLDMTTQ